MWNQLESVLELVQVGSANLKAEFVYYTWANYYELVPAETNLKLEPVLVPA